MKNFTSFVAAVAFSFLGLGLTGCGGTEESTVIEQTAETGDAALETQEQMDQYAAEMEKKMAEGQGN